MQIKQHFTEHPASVGETYGEHFKVAAGFSGSLAIAAMAAAVHAVVPSCCSKTASRRIIAMHERITSGARAGNLDTANRDVVDQQAGTNRSVAAA